MCVWWTTEPNWIEEGLYVAGGGFTLLQNLMKINYSELCGSAAPKPEPGGPVACRTGCLCDWLPSGTFQGNLRNMNVLSWMCVWMDKSTEPNGVSILQRVVSVAVWLPVVSLREFEYRALVSWRSLGQLQPSVLYTLGAMTMQITTNSDKCLWSF